MSQIEELLTLAVRLDSVTLFTPGARVDGEPNDTVLFMPRGRIGQRTLRVTRLHERATRIEPLEHDGLAAEAGELDQLAVVVLIGLGIKCVPRATPDFRETSEIIVGAFRDRPETRAEFMELIKSRGGLVL